MYFGKRVQETSFFPDQGNALQRREGFRRMSSAFPLSRVMFADRWVLHNLTAWSLMRDRAQVGAALLADADMRGEANRTERQQARGRCVV